MIQEKHEIGINGWDNEALINMSLENIHIAINKTHELISKYTNGYSPISIRPVNGNINKEISKYIIHVMGYQVILWSIDSKDWEFKDPKAIVNHIMSLVKPGDIIVLHDTLPHVVPTVKLLIEDLQRHGYELATISELLYFPDDAPH